MGRLYLSGRVFSERNKGWVSFESNPRFDRTKEDIYKRCVPCISHLYEQLKDGKREVDLGYAFDCWKVVVVVDNMDACVDLLSEYERLFLKDRWVKGRFGSGDSTKKTKVVVFNAEDESEKDRLIDELNICIKNTGLNGTVTSHKACAELYHELFGDWGEWKRRVMVKDPSTVPSMLEKIREILYWKSRKKE
ncbi:MAG: hypothetical protein N2745_04760 [Syntrophorhabdaceae bacterium]|nr:hypothetical protein [Syntrophorhabdaceae bacterium]